MRLRRQAEAQGGVRRQARALGLVGDWQQSNDCTDTGITAELNGWLRAEEEDQGCNGMRTNFGPLVLNCNRSTVVG